MQHDRGGWRCLRRSEFSSLSAPRGPFAVCPPAHSFHPLVHASHDPPAGTLHPHNHSILAITCPKLVAMADDFTRQYFYVTKW